MRIGSLHMVQDKVIWVVLGRLNIGRKANGGQIHAFREGEVCMLITASQDDVRLLSRGLLAEVSMSDFERFFRPMDGMT